MAMNDPISAPEKKATRSRYVPGSGQMHRHVLVVLEPQKERASLHPRTFFHQQLGDQSRRLGEDLYLGLGLEVGGETKHGLDGAALERGDLHRNDLFPGLRLVVVLLAELHALAGRQQDEVDQAEDEMRSSEFHKRWDP